MERERKVEKVADKRSKKEGSERKSIKRGLKALREIKLYQLNTKMLIRMLPFQQVVQEIFKSIRANLHFQSTVIMVLHEAGEVFLVGLSRLTTA